MKKPKEKSKPEMVYKSTLKTRFGLTDTLIKKLGEPDEFTENPHYKSGPPSQLYLVKRVERFVKRNSEAVNIAKTFREPRKKAAAQAVRTKREELIKLARTTLLVFIKALPATCGALHEFATSHAYARYRDPRTPGLNGVLSTIRHEFTNYERILNAFRNRVGCGDVGPGSAYWELRKRLDTEVEIAFFRAYPEQIPPGGTWNTTGV
jgi:hypothetical protein